MSNGFPALLITRIRGDAKAKCALLAWTVYYITDITYIPKIESEFMCRSCEYHKT